MRRNTQELVTQLGLHGLHFFSFSVSHQGQYRPSDADWNYKDVPHLNVIHPLVDTVLADVGDDTIATVNFQSVLGLVFPLVVYNYAVSESVQTYFTTLFMFVLVVETRFESVTEDTTLVTTTYHVGSSRIFQLLKPIIRWLLRRNYDSLMAGDVPMRTRRGWLRARGYRFVRDDTGHGFRATMRLTDQNVIPPPGRPPPAPATYSLEELHAGPVLFGEEDHLGLRLELRDDEIAVFPRMCLHEGAGLDAAPCRGGKLRCPWHGRVLGPLTELRVDSGGAATATQTLEHEISLVEGTITIRPLASSP